MPQITIKIAREWDDSYAAVNHPNEDFSSPNLQIGAIAGQNEAFMAFPLALPASVLIERVALRMRYKEDVTGPFAANRMTLGFAKREYGLVDPNTPDGRFIKNKMIAVRARDSGNQNAGQAQVNTFNFWLPNCPQPSGFADYMQEFELNGADVFTLGVNTRRVGSLPAEELLIDLYQVDENAPPIKRGPLLGTARIPFNSLDPANARWEDIPLDDPIIAPTPGTRVVAHIHTSFAAVAPPQFIVLLGVEEEIGENTGDDAARDGYRFAASGDSWLPLDARRAHAFGGFKMLEERDYPHMYIQDVEPQLQTESVDLITEFGWEADGTVVERGTTGGRPNVGQWYEISSDDRDELRVALQAYVDDPFHNVGDNLVIVMGQPANLGTAIGAYYTVESGDAAELVIDYQEVIDLDKGELRSSGRGITVSPRLSGSISSSPRLRGRITIGS